MNSSQVSLKKLLFLCRGEWLLLALGLFFLVISSACLLIYPQSIKIIIDEAIKSENQQSLNDAAYLALAVFTLQAITSSFRYYFFTIAGEKTVKKLRSTLFERILIQDMVFFDRQKTGELLGRLSADTAVLQNALSVNISMLLRSLGQAIGSLIMLFTISPKLTVFILLIIPPLGLFAVIFGKRVKVTSKKTQDALANSFAIAEESLSGIRTVKAFAQESLESSRYNNRLDQSFELSKLKIKEIAKFSGLVSFVGLCSIVFIIWYGGTLVIEKHMTVGSLTSFLLYVMTVAFSVAMMASLYTDFMSALGASNRLFELIDRVPDLDKNPEGLKMIKKGKIEFNSVSFSYPARPEVQVLNEISFSINPYETIAIVGSSGGGKSTIVQLIIRFYELMKGSIKIDDRDLKDYHLESLRRGVGLVSQEPILISETLFENIRYGKPSASLEEVIEAAKQAYAHDFISKFPDGYQTLVGEKGVQLSGGQKQRVAIARALIKDPRILILDEATSALDAESEFLVQESLKNLLGKRTTIIIAHRLSTIKQADKILVLDQGRMVQEGTHQDLLLNPDGIYKKLIERQYETNQEV
jgi:ABC-type multidrug transport system fused ATPase/permease subunit